MSICWLDCTLRDGGYYTNWSYSEDLLKKYYSAINDIAVDYVEVGLRQIRKNNYKGPFAYCHEQFLDEMLDGLEKPVAVMVDAKELIADDANQILNSFAKKNDSVISLVRIACNQHEISFIIDDLKQLSDLGYKIVINLMQAGQLSDNKIREFISCLPLETECLYFADSLGNMVPKDIERVMNTIKQTWDGAIGFHAHNNMGQASINVQVAIDFGASWIDSTITGMGRGAGNYETEVHHQNYNGRDSSSIQLIEAVENVFQPLKVKLGWGRSMFYELGAIMSVHPTYIQRLIGVNKLDTHAKINCIKELAKSDFPNKFSAQVLQASLANVVNSGPFIHDKSEPMDLTNNSVVLVVDNPDHSIDIKAVSSLSTQKDWKIFSINGCSFIDECNGIFALRNLNFTRLINTLTNTNMPIISDRVRFSDIPGFDVDFNASYEIGNNYHINEEGLINLREELTIIYATLYCWWSGAKNIFWIGADGKGVEISELREMTSAISELKNLGINIKTLSETVYDIPFACHWNFYD
jgi:4-hydroxy 2-oxovalerate aldolase